MVRSGDRLFYVGVTGRVDDVVAISDESQGVCQVTMPTGAQVQARTFDLFKTHSAANRAAINRLPSSVPASSGPRIVR